MTAGKVKEGVNVENESSNMRSLLTNNFREAGTLLSKFPTTSRQQEG